MDGLDNGLTSEQSLFDWVPVGLARVDTAGQIVAVNAVLLAWLGFDDAGELVGRDFLSLFAAQEAQARWIEFVEVGDVIVSFPFACRLRDGRSERTRLDARKVRNQEGQVVYLDVSMQSLAAQGQVEQSLSSAKALAGVLSRVNSRFLGKASHDLLTPLNSILGFSQLLARDGRLNADQLTSVQAILRAGRALFAHLNEILEFIQAESTGLELQELLPTGEQAETKLPAVELPAAERDAQRVEHFVMPAVHAAVPAEWVAAMQRALLLGDFLKLLDLIEMVRPVEAELANALQKLANEFDYGQIRAVLETLTLLED